MKAHLNHRQPGQIIVLAAVVMAAMLGMVAFVVDAGIFLETRRELQNTADAAALAGVALLPPDAPLPITEDCADVTATSIEAHQLACRYAEANAARTAARLCNQAPSILVRTDKMNLDEGGFVYIITVTPSCDGDAAPGYTFGRVLGLVSMPIRASATAARGSLIDADCPIPFAVEEKVPDSGGEPNNFGWELGETLVLELGDRTFIICLNEPDNCGANDVRDWLGRNPCQRLRTGDDLWLKSLGASGAEALGPVLQGFVNRGEFTKVGNKVVCNQSWSEVAPDGVNVVKESPCLGVMPVLKYGTTSNLNGTSNPVGVMGFGLFFIEEYRKVGSVTELQGRFVRAPALAGSFGLFAPDGNPIWRLIR